MNLEQNYRQNSISVKMLSTYAELCYSAVETPVKLS